jgi:hypothetical protein
VKGLEAANPRHEPFHPEVIALDALLQVFGDVIPKGARCDSRVFPPVG